MNKNRVVITGIGINCCLGKNKNNVKKNLNLNITGLKKYTSSSNKELRNFFVGKPISDVFNLSEYSDLEEIERMSIDVAKAAIVDSKIPLSYFEKEDNTFSLSFGTSLAGIDHIMKAQEENELYNIGSWLLHARRFSYLMMAELNLKGTCVVDSSACASGTASVGIGFDLIKNNEADLVLAGGTDNLSDFSLFGFHSLQNLSSGICKPFDKKREGINLGGGASFFVLENRESAIRRGAKIYGEITGYGLYNDAYHITSPDPDGYAAKQSMKSSLKNILLDYDSKIYINAHGTGTKLNDSMEYKAIEEYFKKYENITFSSTKSRTGHCLGASGSIELAISLIGLEESRQYKTINSNMDIGLNNPRKFNHNELVDVIISNSFAFGGNSASISIHNAL